MNKTHARFLNYLVIIAFATAGIFAGSVVGSFSFERIHNPTRDQFINTMIGTPIAGFAILGAAGIYVGSWIEDRLKYKI